MNDYIAVCGLDCEHCDARIATADDDAALRERVAALWSELNGVTITPDMICCDGCRIDGRKTPYCQSLCPIRQCALAKGLSTCAGCGELLRCEKVGMILRTNDGARQRLTDAAEGRQHRTGPQKAPSSSTAWS